MKTTPETIASTRRQLAEAEAKAAGLRAKLAKLEAHAAGVAAPVCGLPPSRYRNAPKPTPAPIDPADLVTDPAEIARLLGRPLRPSPNRNETSAGTAASEKTL